MPVSTRPRFVDATGSWRPGVGPTLPVGGPPPLSDSPPHGDPLDAECPVRAPGLKQALANPMAHPV